MHHFWWVVQENEIAQINRTQREELISGRAVKKSKSNGYSYGEHNSVAKQISNVWNYAALAFERPDTKHGHPDVRIRRYGSPIKKGKNLAFSWILAKKTENGNRIYSVELADEKNYGVYWTTNQQKLVRMPPSVALRKLYSDLAEMSISKAMLRLKIIPRLNNAPFLVGRSSWMQ